MYLYSTCNILTNKKSIDFILIRKFQIEFDGWPSDGILKCLSFFYALMVDGEKKSYELSDPKKMLMSMKYFGKFRYLHVT